MRFLKLTVRIIGLLAVLAGAVPVLAIMLLQIPAGRALLSGMASTLASSDNQKITIEGLYLAFDLEASVDRVTLADADGVWFEADSIDLNWSPISLLTGTLNIEAFTANQVNLNRPPASEPPSETSSADQSAASESNSTGLPLDVILGKLDISEINLGEAVLGTPVSLTAAGSAAAAADPLSISGALNIERIDGVDGTISAKAQFEPAEETLVFDVSVAEPSGGMAARLLDLPDLPSLKLDLKGSGPLTDWAADLAVALDGHTTVTGSARISEQDAIRLLTFDLDGDLARLAPPEAQAFLLGTTKATGNASFSEDFVPQSGQIDLTTQTVSLTASANTWEDRIMASAELSVSAGQGALIAVDLADRRIAFGPLKAVFSADGPLSAMDWDAKTSVASFQTTEARLRDLSLSASGQNANLSPEVQTLPINLKVTVADLTGLTAETDLLTGPVSLSLTGLLKGARKSADIHQLALSTAFADVSLDKTVVSATSLVGSGQLKAEDLSRAAQLAGRPIGGSLSTTFSFDLNPVEAKGSADVAAVAQDLQTGQSQADALFKGETNLDTSLVLSSPEDITVKSLSLRNQALTASATVHYQPDDVVSDLKASLESLTRLDPQMSGSLQLAAQTSGPIEALKVATKITSQQVLLGGTPLDDLNISADVTADVNAPVAAFKGSASLNGQPLLADIDVTSKNGGAEINPLTLSLAGNSVSGNLSVSDLEKALETVSGSLKIDAPDLSTLSPLAMTDLGGQVTGTLSADPDAEKLDLDLTGTDLDVPSVSLGTLRLKANLAAPYDPRTLSADLTLQDLLTSATPIRSATLSARPDGTGTAIAADIRIEDGADDGLTMSAHVSEPQAGQYLLALKDLGLKYQGLSSRLLQPANISHANGTTTLEPVELKLGSGSLTVSGQAGEILDLTASFNKVPLNLANAFVPSLGLDGTLSGQAKASGSATAPKATWSITGNGLTAAELRKNGLNALALTTNGSLANNQITQSTSVTGNGGLALSADGTVGLDAPMPLALTINGTAPAAALRKPLVEAGIRAEGAIKVAGRVSGSAKAPAYQITASPAGLKVTSLSTGLTIQNIRGSASVTQDRATLNGLAADLATGGSLSASGSVGMKDGFAADLALSLDKARYVDPGLVIAEVDADVKISGPLASPSNAALISGTVTINKADVSIPESLPGSIPPVDVRHVNAPLAIKQQVAELGGETNRAETQQKSNPPRLDVLISAPGRIFVRGRGLDAELQGNLKIVGTTADPQAIGAFSLRRGQLDILTRRLTFSRGSATFEGSMTPILDFAATTTVSSTTITVTVSGDADDPKIAFSSSPELPQDEVLALLLFGKSVGNLSATQVAQLAAAIRTLTGGSDSGPLAQIRKSLGLDAIDINTDGDDGPSVGVGKYINDNIYLGVEQGANSNSSRVKVDIDLDRGLKLRGEVGADGSSKAGIFFEKEY